MPTVSNNLWRFATFVLTALLTLAVAFVPMIYTPIVASSMKSIARQEVEDHREKLHKDTEQRAELAGRLAEIGVRLDRIEAALALCAE